MDIVGFSQDEKQSIYTLLSAILNLGNVTFDEVFDKRSGHNLHDAVALTNAKCKLSSNNYNCPNISKWYFLGVWLFCAKTLNFFVAVILHCVLILIIILRSIGSCMNA